MKCFTGISQLTFPRKFMRSYSLPSQLLLLQSNLPSKIKFLSSNYSNKKMRRLDQEIKPMKI